MDFSKPEAKVIADSINHDGNRLVTIEAKIHRFTLAEVNTHRVFSRNSASSRAIPAAKLRAMVLEDPAVPVYWGKNQKGMQAAEELEGLARQDAIDTWLKARDAAVAHHIQLESIGVHKQIANRIIEPWLWHRVIITATEWDNCFWQRCHPDAQPEFHAAAEAIYDVYSASSPIVRGLYRSDDHRNWHLPYVSDSERDNLQLEDLKAISVGRCARVSYLTHDGKRDVQADIDLYNRLIRQFPGHWSPLEHVATPQKASYEKTGNFKGWVQLRGLVEPKLGKFVHPTKGEGE